MLSPTVQLLAYIHDLLAEIAVSGIGFNTGGMSINILGYADDIVLLASGAILESPSAAPDNI